MVTVDNTSLQQAITDILVAVGEDPTREGLKDTPARVAELFQELYSGVGVDPISVLTDARPVETTEGERGELVALRDIAFHSLCEHHLLPFIGKCHVAYIPTGKVLGLSKVARIVDVFARRLQIQEALTYQIAETIMDVTDAQGVGVIIEAQHMCMMMRGVEKQNAMMKTSMMLGSFRSNPATRAEFLSLVN